MVLSFKTGSFTSRTTTGTDTVTGVGFTPKLILLWTTAGGTESTYAARFTLVYGGAVDTTAANQQVIFATSRNSGATSYAEEAFQSASAYTYVDDATITATGVISAIGADGFTMNWTLNDGVAKLIYFICIGGADITSTKAAEFTSPTQGSTGNQVTSGVGFQPDFLMLYGTSEAGATADYSCVWCLGFAISSSEQASVSGVALDGVATMDTARYQRGDDSKCYMLFSDSSTTTKALEGNLVSMNADGFTINWTTVGAAGASKKIGYIALKGGNYAIGAITAPVAGTVPVSQQTSGIGFQPTGIMMLSCGATANTAINTNMRLSLGAGSGSTDRRLGWAGDKDAVADTANSRIMLPDKIVKVSTENATAANTTTQAEADLTSLDSDGFTLSWTTRDTNAYEVIYIAFGSSAAAKTLYIAKAFFKADG